MNTTPKVSEAEWVLMEIIWQVKRIKASEVIERLSDSAEWKPKTIKTMLNRLLSKEIIGYEKDGKDPLAGLAESVGYVKGVMRGMKS